jgi:hypothetical protein
LLAGLNLNETNEKVPWSRAMNSPSLLGGHTLDNGLSLEFWDHSRPLVGDRRFVCLVGRIAIPVRAETLPPELQAQAAQVVEALGEEIFFTQRQERNFIAASEAPALLQDMQDRILALGRGYLGQADFAGRFIRKKWAELQELQRWQRLDTRGESS